MEAFKVKRYIKFWIKSGIFLLLLLLCVRFVNILLTPKYFYTNDWPTTSTYVGFYQMERETIDVFFLGSSHAVSGFSPQQLYNEYEIRSYNLGCEQQNLVTSYYWLKEALRYQTPEVVVLDTYLLFPQENVGPLNSIEGCTRKAFDFMKWSPIKIEAINQICSIDTTQDKLSYYMPNVRYHTRWSELDKEDYSSLAMFTRYELKGYSMLKKESGIKDFCPFEGNAVAGKEEILEYMEDYLLEIIELCDKNDIQLLLVKTPCIYETKERYQATKVIADIYSIPFYDFNEKDIYKDLGYCMERDNYDSGHANAKGAKKLTAYIGNLLIKEFGVTQQQDIQWEQTKQYYDMISKEAGLY